MGINAKYFIISIASIFISLGLGIFIGFNMNGQELYLEQHQALVNSLENKFTEYQQQSKDFQEEIKNLNIENEKKDNFIQDVFSELINKKLSDLNIAIIETTDNYSYNDIEKTLISSGADVPIRVRYTDKIFTITQEDLKYISDLIGIELNEKSEFVNLINNEIVSFIVYNKRTDIVQFLIDKEYIVFNLSEDSIDKFSIDTAIVTGGSIKNRSKKIGDMYIGINLIKKLHNQGIRVIGVEKTETEVSFVPKLKEINVSTVDNIDTLIGKISLVYLLKGDFGHYGEKPSADFLSPLVVKDLI